MDRYLIITADDFGFSKERNQGVAEVLKKSAGKSVSLLLNCTGTEDAVLFIKRNACCAGLHLNLTEGPSLCKTKHTTLTDDASKFWGKFELRKLLDQGSICQQEIRQEILSQIEEFTRLVGRRPAYVDGHQHIHVHPAVSKIFASTLHAYNIQATRFPVEMSLETKTGIHPKSLEFYNKVMEDAQSCKSTFDSNGIRTTDTFVGLSTMGANMTVGRLQSALLEAFEEAENRCDTSKPYFTCELMTHPGYVTGKYRGGFDWLSDDFGCSNEREHEIKVLTSEEMFEFYKENNIHLVPHDILFLNPQKFG